MRSSFRRPKPLQLALAAGVFVLALGLGLRPGLDWARRGGENVKLQESESLEPPGGQTAITLPPWPEPLARRVFPIDAAAVFDPQCGFRHAPQLALPQFLQEHTPPEFLRVTNSLGLREDSEPIVPRPRLRILVTGDSHTDGVCTNPESFANQLEARLRERSAAAALELGTRFEPNWIEVLNAGKGSYSFCNYYGVLARFLELDLAPDVFVVAIYGGNDFEETLNAHYLVHGGERPPGKALYLRQVREAKKVHAGALAQGLLAAKYFAVQPSQVEVGVASSLEWLERILALARSRGIEVVVAYIPPWFSVTRSVQELPLERLLASLELDAAALQTVDSIASRVLDGLRARGVEALDLRPAFAAAEQGEEAAYWRTDLHISVRGQRIVAEGLEPLLLPRARATLSATAQPAADPQRPSEH